MMATETRSQSWGCSSIHSRNLMVSVPRSIDAGAGNKQHCREGLTSALALAMLLFLMGGSTAFAASTSGGYLARTSYPCVFAIGGGRCGGVITTGSNGSGGFGGTSIDFDGMRAEALGTIDYGVFRAGANALSNPSVAEAQRGIAASSIAVMSSNDSFVLRSPGRTGLAQLTIDYLTSADSRFNALALPSSRNELRGSSETSFSFAFGIGDSRQNYAQVSVRSESRYAIDVNTGLPIVHWFSRLQETQHAINPLVALTTTTSNFSSTELSDGIRRRATFVVPLDTLLGFNASLDVRAFAGAFMSADLDAGHSVYLGGFRLLDLSGSEIPFTLTAASRFDYTAPIVQAVPLSPSLVLLASGAVLLVGVSRHGRASRRVSN